MYSKPLIFVVISVLAIAYISFSEFAQGKPVAGGYIECDLGEIYGTITCCWYEEVVRYGIPTSKYVCQTCTEDGTNCGPIEDWRANKVGGDVTGPLGKEGVLQPLTPPLLAPPTAGERVPPGGGVIQQQPPTDQGAAELPATEGTQPATVEEEPPVPVCQEGQEFNEDLGFCVPTECPEGQELNEETGICVLEEQPAAAAEEPEEQQQTEEEQPSEESGSEEDNSNN
ncbi:MAG: hypothetical protein ACRD47_07265 [Nitrososphaeraceae archaeon]